MFCFRRNRFLKTSVSAVFFVGVCFSCAFASAENNKKNIEIFIGGQRYDSIDEYKKEQAASEDQHAVSEGQQETPSDKPLQGADTEEIRTLLQQLIRQVAAEKSTSETPQADQDSSLRQNEDTMAPVPQESKTPPAQAPGAEDFSQMSPAQIIETLKAMNESRKTTPLPQKEESTQQEQEEVDWFDIPPD